MTNSQDLANMARGSLLVPLCMVAMAWMEEAMAMGTACHSIKDVDKRAFCLGQVRQNHDYCYRIRDADRRNECLARTEWARDRCHTIKENDIRKACLVQTR
jgi:hypothetical protein